MKFIETDGGRSKAGFVGTTGDCVTRALAIATGEPYKLVYNELFETAKEYSRTKKDAVAERIRIHGATPRRGVNKQIYDIFLKKRGWGWIPKKEEKNGKCLLNEEYFGEKKGTYIVRVSKHLTVVKDGVLLDSYDCSREGKRGVYGYYRKLK